MQQALWHVMFACGSIIMLCLLSSCSGTHRYQYQYAMIAPQEDQQGIIEDTQARVQLIATAEVGVFAMEISNKSVDPIAIVWAQSYYLDPFGRRRQALQAGTQRVFRAPGWDIADTRLGPGATIRVTVRPGPQTTLSTPEIARIRSPADPRLPPEDDTYGGVQTGGQLAINPFVATRYTGGEVAVSGAAAPLVPASGNSPALGASMQDKEFRFVLTLRHGLGYRPYTYTFRITDVQVESE